MIVFYVFIAESPAVFADCEPDTMAAGSIVCAGVFGEKSSDREATFYADWHFIYEVESSVDVAGLKLFVIL